MKIRSLQLLTVGRLALRHLSDRNPLRITAQIKIPAAASGVCRVFLFLSLDWASSSRAKNKNPRSAKRPTRDFLL